MKWDAPNDNGSPITSYTVYATIAGSVATTCTTNGEQTCIIKGLKNDQPYVVMVAATNANGSSRGVPGRDGHPEGHDPGPGHPQHHAW